MFLNVIFGLKENKLKEKKWIVKDKRKVKESEILFLLLRSERKLKRKSSKKK